MGYSDLFDYHVLPIARAQRLADGNYSRPQWVGTGFTFGEGTFVTCWHCVGANLADDEVYFAAGRERGNQQSLRSWPIELRQLARDVNGADLALGRIDPRFLPRLTLAADPLQWGDDVVALGFPHTLDTTDADTGDKRIETHARVFKGYVTRLFYDDYQRQPVVELNIPAPVGMSGAPLFTAQPPLIRDGQALDPIECYGVIFGEHSLHAPDGIHRHGTALLLDALRNASGPATDGLPLAQYLERPDAKASAPGNTAPSE
ncbi:serine protease [Streptomyces sp. NPDC101455]|uniref:S1 family peptidase n=1 Tax=Streptomyces sp. NPDC101455 TaxID=3366142 RepID=UPI0038160485